MFISIEKACELTGKSKNVLYRLMSKGYINFVRCTKGKRYLEVAELRRVYGPLNGVVVQPDVSLDGANQAELAHAIEQMRDELNKLAQIVSQQTTIIESLVSGGVQVTTDVVAKKESLVSDSPEKDPDWPPFITCYADLAKRDEIKAKYEK